MVQGTGQLRISAILIYKKGGRKVTRVQVDDTSPKAKEYLGFEVLEGEAGNSFYGSRLGSSFRCSVEVWFYSTDSTDIGFVDSLMGFKVNDNGNDNSNGGEALSDSTGLQIIIANDNCNVNGNDNDNGSTGW